MSLPSAGSRSGLRYAEVVDRLRPAGKSSATAPLYSRWVNRPLGRRLAAVAHLAGRTPDQVTAVSGLVTFSGIVLVALCRPSVVVGIAVTFLLVLGYALDSADGQLARLRGGGSLTGEWLDHMVDCAKNASVHLALLISLYRFGDTPPALFLLPAAFQLVVTVMFFGTVLTDKLRLAGTTGGPAGPGRHPLARSVLVAPADYGLLCVAFVLFGARPAFLTVYAVLFLGSAAYLAVGLVRWHHQVAAADAARQLD